MLSAKDGIADDNVLTVYEDHRGDVWLITITGGVYRYSQGRVSRVPLPKEVTENRVRLVYEDSKGDLWFGTATAGAIRLSHGRASIYTTREGLRNNAVRQFYEDRKGQLWIALGSGLSRWDGHAFHSYYVEDGLAYGSVRVVIEDRAGDIIVGTDGGLNRIHEGAFVTDAAFQELRGEKVWDIHEDRDGTLWAATRAGISHPLRPRRRRITMRDGPQQRHLSVLEDDGGKLWMSSGRRTRVPRAEQPGGRRRNRPPGVVPRSGRGLESSDEWRRRSGGMPHSSGDYG